MKRRSITTLDRLKIVARQALCPLCGERLGDLDGLDFDHEHALGLGGTDTLDNLSAVHRQCHRIKTSGSKATTLGSDIHAIAKGRRLSAEYEDFRRRMLAKEPGTPRTTTSRMKSRGFRKRPKGA